MFSTQVALAWLLEVQNRFFDRILNEWTPDAHEFVHQTLPRLAGIVLIALVLNKLVNVLTRRMVRVAEMHAAGPARIGAVKTLASVIRATGLAIIGTIAGLQFLAAVGMNLAPLLTSAGIAGVAIGLAAQTIVKDVFNGVLILVEAQFNVGDVVKIAGVTGTVEAMSLRKTTIRDGGDGTLYMIPNSQITTVGNMSADYSVSTVPVSVDFSANPDEVMALLKQAAMEVRNSPEFRDLFKADPEVLGVDAVKGSQLIFPVVFKTLATKQYGPMREFQRRVRLALEEHRLLPGDPLRVYGAAAAAQRPQREGGAPLSADPTTMKPQETNPFSGE